MKTPDKFYAFRERSDIGVLTINTMIINPLPIVWNRDGEFCVIPIAVVQNAVDHLEMYKNLSSGKTINPVITIRWSQGITISNQAGRALLGE